MMLPLYRSGWTQKIILGTLNISPGKSGSRGILGLGQGRENFSGQGPHTEIHNFKGRIIYFK